MPEKLPEIITEEEIIKIVDGTKSNKHKLAFLLGLVSGGSSMPIINLNPSQPQIQVTGNSTW